MPASIETELSCWLSERQLKAGRSEGQSRQLFFLTFSLLGWPFLAAYASSSLLFVCRRQV